MNTCVYVRHKSGRSLGFPWIIQSMIESLKLFTRPTNGRTAWSMYHDGFRRGFIQECGRLRSVKLTKTVSVEVGSWMNQLCSADKDPTVLATVWNKCATIICKLLCSFSTDKAQRSFYLSMFAVFPNPSLLTRWSQTLKKNVAWSTCFWMRVPYWG